MTMADYARISHDVTDYPPWGTLGLDIFLLEHWTDIPDANQHLQLVRHYIALGSLGRKPYIKRATTNPPQPSPLQISNVLQPVRPPPLRHVAGRLSSKGNHIWLRTSYADDETHANLCQSLESVEASENLSEDSLILSDARYYDFGSSWERVLDVLPEILDSQGDAELTTANYRMADFRRKMERDYTAHTSHSPDSELALAKQQSCCPVRTIFIEDHQTHVHGEERMRVIWPDDFGNVVRENRVTLQEACDYLSVVDEGMAGEDPIWVEARAGEKYGWGGEFGPPFRN